VHARPLVLHTNLTNPSANLYPETPDNTLLLTTNTEVSIAPKPHRPQQTGTGTAYGGPGKALPPKEVQKPSENDKGATSTQSRVLRVLPRRLVHTVLPEYQGIELLAYVAVPVFRELYGTSRPDNTAQSFTCIKSTIKRLVPPIDPTSQSSVQTNGSEPRGDKSAADHDGGRATYIFVGALDDLPPGHIVFPAAPEGVEEWDNVM
jgi:peroxin-1